jgi:MFS family permease
MRARPRARAQLWLLDTRPSGNPGETVTIPERSVRTVLFVSEARWSRTAAVAGVVMLAMWIIGMVLAALDHQLSASSITTGTGFAVFAVVGAVVAFHQPRNPVGWLLICFTFFFMLGIDAQEYAVYCYLLGHRLPFTSAAVVLKQSANFAFFLLPLAVFLFPDGRLTTPRWWWVLSAYAVVSGFFTASAFAPAIAAVADHDVHIDTSADLVDTGRLTGWLIHPPGWLTVAGGLLIAGIWASFVIHQILSWRRSDGERRQQLKWLACGAAVTLGIGVGASSVVPGFLSWIFGIALFALPVSIGVGILKYRLYDIDRIISRTLAYAIVTGLLIGVYTGLVLLTTHLLTFSSSVAVAASTLVAAALFNPVRRWVQHAVDRRFNRARYDAEQTVAAFAARLKDAVDLDSVRADLAAVVDRTLEPAHLTLWIGSAGEDLASADREPVAALLAVVGEPGPEQGGPGGQDPALDQGQGGAVLAGQAEPLGEHSPVAAASS